MLGSHLIKSWSRTQDAVGVRSMCREWQLAKEGQASRLFADASAALSIATRQGAGKMRHINVKSLWLQERALQEEPTYEKIKGKENPADGLTKYVRKELAERYASVVGLRFSADIAQGSLQLSGGEKPL